MLGAKIHDVATTTTKVAVYPLHRIFWRKKVAIVATPRISVHFALFHFGLSWLHILCFCGFFSLAFLVILALGGFMCFQFGICCFTFATNSWAFTNWKTYFCLANFGASIFSKNPQKHNICVYNKSWTSIVHKKLKTSRFFAIVWEDFEEQTRAKTRVVLPWFFCQNVPATNLSKLRARIDQDAKVDPKPKP